MLSSSEVISFSSRGLVASSTAHGCWLCKQAAGKVSAPAESQAGKGRGNQRGNRSLLSLAHQDSLPSGTAHHGKRLASVLCHVSLHCLYFLLSVLKVWQSFS